MHHTINSTIQAQRDDAPSIIYKKYKIYNIAVEHNNYFNKLDVRYPIYESIYNIMLKVNRKKLK